MSTVSLLSRNCWCSFVALAIGLLAATVLIERAFAFTNCFTDADCIPNQSCVDDCIDGVGFTADLVNCPAQAGPPMVPARIPCLLFSGATTNSSTPMFQTCIPSSTSTHQCQNTPITPPVTTCTTGSGYFCSCMTSTGDCLNGAVFPPCDCLGTVTYANMGFTINSLC